MKRIDENQIKDKKIDETIRAAFGFSDEQIQAELEDAAANPDTSPELKAPDDEYQKILQKIQERGIQPVPLGTEGKAPVTPHPKKKIFTFRRMRRTLIAAAALGIAFVGFSLNSVGKSATQYRVIDSGRKNNIVWNSAKGIEGITDEKQAYAEVEKNIKVPALKMGYIPEGMIFEKLVLSEKSGIIQFIYNGKYFCIYQWGTQTRKNGIHGKDSKALLTHVYNPWLGKKLEVYKENMENNEKKYSIDIKDSEAGTSYFISGVMEEAEFLKIAKDLYIDNSYE
ncbi:DUF4367 domain-containing protein [Clostridium sp. AM58-1XD]|uniref:DUF4367 domain-containing protein n=1 Tax=Clostridium sp. AM58-1XD TaxID=2292307 RepID=UPI000E5572E6|nr:DUF4367 domain-containing protein [Clostridium sp. AM58-1XD]RGY97348.1 DUF4367 domain-containing protein [Clostridium sp. AM58-1XD]